MKEYNEIVGERPSPLNSDLERECEKYEEAHHVSSHNIIFWIRYYWTFEFHDQG